MTRRPTDGKAEHVAFTPEELATARADLAAAEADAEYLSSSGASAA